MTALRAALPPLRSTAARCSAPPHRCRAPPRRCAASPPPRGGRVVASASAHSDAEFSAFAPKVAFLFPGQGAQSVGMAKARQCARYISRG